MRSVRALLLSVAAVLLTACVQVLEPPTAPSGIALTLVCEDAVRTKVETTEPGVRSYHENLISWVDFYFFPGKMPEGDPAEWKANTESKLHFRKTSGEQDQASFQMNLSATAIEQLFPEGKDKMTVLAIANYPGTTITEAANPTFADLDSIAVSADFVGPTDHRQDRFMMRGVKVLDLIDADADLVCKDTVRLERYASKMTVAVKVADTVHLAEHEVWRPMLDGMVIYLEDGVNTVRLGGRDSNPEYFSYYNNWMRFVSKDRQGNLTPLVGQDSIGYIETYPMYMYPQCWKRGSVTAPWKEPSLKLIIPWYREEYDDGNIHITPTQKQCYYKVVMPDNFGNCFQSNRWYHIGLDVKILGALTAETPVTITGSSVIAYWQDRDVVVKQAEVGRARYLSVDQNRWEISNLNELDIPFLSSHPVTIDSIVVTRPYFGNMPAGTDTLGGVVIDSTGGTKYLSYDEAHRKAMSRSMSGVEEDWLRVSGSAVEFRHVLNNDYQVKRFDYSPYTVSFRLKHDGSEEYHQDVTIIQYPAIYISRIRNSDPDTAADGTPLSHHTPDKDTAHARSTYYGFTFVDGAYKYNESTGKFDFKEGERQQRNNNNESWDDYHYLGNNEADKKDYRWRSVFYTGGSIDMYNIHISVLPSEFNFVIGDPRVTEIDNLGYRFVAGANSKLSDRENFADTRAMYGLPIRHLAYYYPTEASERTRNMLAPSYRVCSKFGGIEFKDITLEYARYRCAAYQEDGFPAGRWRIPTQAEVSFISQLSANGSFEVLFNKGGYYWSANGAVHVTDNDVVLEPGRTEALLRCVYDTWYWGEDQSEYDAWRRRYAPPAEGEYLHDKFVWGDRPR